MDTHVHTHLDHIVTSSYAASIVGGILRHLMLMKGQISCTFAQLEKQLAKPESKDSTALNRKSADLVKQQYLLAQTLNLVFENADPACICILFGSSITMPKETCIIELPCVYPDIQYASARSQLEDASLRRIIRDIVMACSSHTVLAQTRMHVLVRAHRTTSVMGLVPKQSFRLPTRGPRTTISITAKTLDAEEDQSDEADDENSEKDFIWFQLPQILHGIE